MEDILKVDNLNYNPVEDSLKVDNLRVDIHSLAFNLKEDNHNLAFNLVVDMVL